MDSESSLMRWLNFEYLLKGAFLGLLLGAALAAPTPQAAGLVAAFLCGGLALGLAVFIVWFTMGGKRKRPPPASPAQPPASPGTQERSAESKR